MMGNNRMIQGGGFHHIAVKAKDFDKSVKFYTQGLGFKEWIRWGEGDKRAIMLDTGDGSCLEIFAGGTGPKPEGTMIHFALNTTDCDGAIAAARAAGAEVTKEPFSVVIQSNPPTPVRIAFCNGPDGEVIEFFQEETK